MRRMLIAVSTAVAMGGVLFAGAAPASAAAPAANAETAMTALASCYGGAAAYTKTSGTFQVPRGAGSFYRTSTRCTDINIKPNQTVWARICFEATGCQSSFKQVLRGQWGVIATNVRDNAPFRIDFTNLDAEFTGVYAA